MTSGTAVQFSAPCVLAVAISVITGCANNEKASSRLRPDREPAAAASAAASGMPATAPSARKVPGQALADMVLDFARNGATEPLGEYFAAGYTADFANARGDTPLILAAYHGHADAVRLILDQPDRVVDRLNQMGFTALAGASFKGDVAIVRLLIEAGADVNATGPDGKTPLMFAALTNREAAVDLLLESGADPLAKATDGSTAASLAAGQGSAALAERLSQESR